MTIGFAIVPVAVINIGAVILSVWPEATLKVTPPVPTPWVLSAVTAAEIVA